MCETIDLKSLVKIQSQPPYRREKESRAISHNVSYKFVPLQSKQVAFWGSHSPSPGFPRAQPPPKDAPEGSSIAGVRTELTGSSGYDVPACKSNKEPALGAGKRADHI
ncbi:hypothetical protein RRG08_020081 [Elysia crispata]|uniref:Uncharacterized protein n=1 Tax=Elysia crispata TaxID=231223 RepID=A0AAE1DSD9_9GAST|nr:hypothetical protein RRG08_020081 [Elysia crispata]